MAAPRVVVIGAGMGGLAAAADLARRGAAVTVLERAAAPGGKMREVMVGGSPIDGGPTVFTMRWIFDGLFADAGASLEAALPLQKADILARHAWRAGGRLDLFADITRSADAIGDFAGAAEARGYRAFCARSADIFRTLRGSFIAAERPSPLDLVKRVGITNIAALIRTAPMKTLWEALGEHFRDPRLRQLFGRYATYCGCSPWLAPSVSICSARCRTMTQRIRMTLRMFWLKRWVSHRARSSSEPRRDLSRVHGLMGANCLDHAFPAKGFPISRVMLF